MKNIAVFISVFLIVSSFTIRKMVITGDFGRNLNGQVSVSVTADNLESKIIATIDITDGKFVFSLEPSEFPGMAYLSCMGSGHKIILEKGDISMNFSRETGFTINGGYYNELIFGWEKSDEVLQINRKIFDLTERYFAKELTEYESKNYTSILVANREAIDQIKKRYLLSLLNHQDYYVRLFAVLVLDDYSEDSMKIIEEIKGKIPINLDIKRYEKAKREAIEREEIKKSLRTGARFTDFKAVTLEGDTLLLSDIAGKEHYTLLEFWASWCHPCREEMKRLKGLYDSYKNRGLKVFSFSVDAKMDDWRKASNSMQIPWINTSGDKEIVDHVSKIYAITSIPKNLLLDKSGKIVATNIKSQNISDYLPE